MRSWGVSVPLRNCCYQLQSHLQMSNSLLLSLNRERQKGKKTPKNLKQGHSNLPRVHFNHLFALSLPFHSLKNNKQREEEHFVSGKVEVTEQNVSFSSSLSPPLPPTSIFFPHSLLSRLLVFCFCASGRQLLKSPSRPLEQSGQLQLYLQAPLQAW